MDDQTLARLVRIATQMAGFPARWFVAGGWALDLFLGRVTGSHADVDVAIFRADQAAWRAHLAGWEWMKAIPGERGRLEPWLAGEVLTLPVHDWHGRKATETTNAIALEAEVLLNESDGERWIFRRDPSIARPIELVGRRSRVGIPVLAPEIVLLHKAPRFKPEDDADLMQT
jgi:hypothetical protein